ncbi:MAG: Hsp70 family protein, partial [Planctomycetaceae bacterium]|nr:Hsp70 family protein [Planctomycetaceae bacterium]
SHYLGIETMGQKFSELLAKGIEIPCENEKTYATTQDNQPEIRITIFQFPKQTDVIDVGIEGSACLGEFHLGPLDPAPKGQQQVTVSFKIDQDGTLKVSAQALGNQGISKELEVKVT